HASAAATPHSGDNVLRRTRQCAAFLSMFGVLLARDRFAADRPAQPSYAPARRPRLQPIPGSSTGARIANLLPAATAVLLRIPSVAAATPPVAPAPRAAGGWTRVLPVAAHGARDHRPHRPARLALRSGGLSAVIVEPHQPGLDGSPARPAA